MLVRHSLRFRIMIAFSVFGAILGIVYSSVVLMGLFRIEDSTFFRHMRLEAELFYQQYQEDPSTARLPHTRFMYSYLGIEQVPSFWQQQLASLTAGKYDLDLIQAGKIRDVYVLVTPLPEAGGNLYLVYDATGLEPMEELMPTVFSILFVAIVLITAIGAWLGMFIARPIIAPLVRLAKLTEQIKPTDLPNQFSDSFYHDEVGVLAQALEQQFLRIHAFIERERSFMRSASHELRTPVTILKGATELLNQYPQTQQAPLQRPLQRINRAVTAMENIIETFLLLSRETWQPDAQASCILNDVLQSCLQQHQHLLDNKPVVVNLQLSTPVTLQAPAALVSIIFANLISNAFNYTDRGFINIYERENSICIQDSGIGIAPEMLDSVTQAYIRGKRGQGYGLGLNIVQSICYRLGWHLSLSSTKEHGTCACVVFTPKQPALTKVG